MKRLVQPLVVTAVLLAAMWFQARTPAVTVCEPPAVHPAEIDGYDSEPVAPTEAEQKVLPADTCVEKRLYRAGSGAWFLVSFVVGGRSKASIHRPELCLPAQGILMRDPETAVLDGRSWRMMTLSGGDRGELGFAYTFFNQAGFRTSSHLARIFRDVWDRSVHNRIDRWVMVTVNASSADRRVLSDFLLRLKGQLR